MDSADVLDDITDFLVNYDGKYKTPAQIVAPFVGGKTVLDSGEVLYTTNDIKTNIIPRTALQRYSSSSQEGSGRTSC